MAGSNESFAERAGCVELLLVLVPDCMFRWCGKVGIMFGSQAAGDKKNREYEGEYEGEFSFNRSRIENLRVGNSLKYEFSRHSTAVARLFGSYMNK